MTKNIHFIVLCALGFATSSLCFAAPENLSATRWQCKTNKSIPAKEKSDPSTKQLISMAQAATGSDDEKMATSSLAHAFASAVKECSGCTEILCTMQK
ncbi:MAG: hypothetical protein H0U75_03775 [Legionella sp.]|nr:hypothetical protein [Legionella sp.]